MPRVSYETATDLRLVANQLVPCEIQGSDCRAVARWAQC